MTKAIRALLWITFAAAVVSAGPTASARAAEVRIMHKGLGLLGESALASGKTWKDGAILLVHGTMVHRGFDAIAHQQKALLEQGLSSLAVTLSLNVPDRRGNGDCAKPQTHRHQDAVPEIATWVGWLKGQGAADITVFGHSRGGNQTLRYALAGADPAVKRIVLLAPTDWSTAGVAGYRDAPAGELPRNLAEAERLAAAGRGGELMRAIRFLSCPLAAVGADAFLSYYRDDGRMNTLDRLGDIRVPTLVIAGTQDTITPDIPAKMRGRTGGHVQLAVIDGADHFFRDLIADEVAEIVAKFLSGG